MEAQLETMPRLDEIGTSNKVQVKVLELPLDRDGHIDVKALSDADMLKLAVAMRSWAIPMQE